MGGNVPTGRGKKQIEVLVRRGSRLLPQKQREKISEVNGMV